MKDLIGRIGRFCENHVEKIVLILVSLVCVWLLFTRVIFSPNVMTIDRTGKAYTPREIDTQIETKAKDLRAKLQGQKKSATTKTYARKLDGPIDAKDPVIAGIIGRPLPQGFAGLFDSPLNFVHADVTTKPSSISPERLYAGRKYRMPEIPDITEVSVSQLRAAAYVPLQPVTMQNTYDKAVVEPNDIDLVTVEARFDVAELYRRFQASFAGVDVQKEEWRDPCLAKPVFAAVQLERQELAEDGAWSDWKPVPRTRVESYRDLFQVVERVEDLPPGGLDVRLMQFRPDAAVMGLLQPESYQIASAEEDWFPPSFYTKYKDLQRKADADKRRDEKEKDRKQTTSTDLRREGMNRGGQQGSPYGGGMQGGRAGQGGRIRPNQQGMPGGDGMYGPQRGGQGGRIRPGQAGGMAGGDPYGGLGQRGGRTGRAGAIPGGPGDPYGGMGMGGQALRRSPTNEVLYDLSKELISYREDLSKREKPVLIWVFDDTTEPGRTYRYRVRLGVFNPVAGTDQFVERDVNKKDQVVLWSRYSEVTKPVAIQNMVYLFAKDVQDKSGLATVEVARYCLGYWRSQDFQVKPGEVIGKVMDVKKDDEQKNRAKARMAGMYGYPPGAGDRITGAGGPPMGPGGMPGMPAYGAVTPEQQNQPKTVNYGTGKFVVDLVPVNDWGSAPNLRPRLYHDMLYTGDGMRIEHMPVNAANWPRDLAAAYQYIQSEKRKEPQPFRSFNKSGLRGRTRGGRGGMEGGYEDMGGGAYEDMGGYEGDPYGGGGGGPYGPY